MKHNHKADVDVKVDIPTQDLEDLVITTGATVSCVIVIYVVADTARHILKTLIK